MKYYTNIKKDFKLLKTIQIVTKPLKILGNTMNYYTTMNKTIGDIKKYHEMLYYYQ